jgi:hypothetical protein
MTLTKSQFEWLQWVYCNGGIARLERGAVVCGETKSPNASAISFLNLVAKGALEGRGGQLLITDYGKRCFGIPESQIRDHDSTAGRP